MGFISYQSTAVRPRVGLRRLPSSVFWARERAPRELIVNS